uniref:Uncharacterized protein n=1 Tax=Arundo donax TaxID=35708 RepID=A0A0A9BTE2_ARUDO
MEGLLLKIQRNMSLFQLCCGGCSSAVWKRSDR